MRRPDGAAPLRVIDSATGKEIADFSAPVETAVTDCGEAEFGPLVYEIGVVHSAMRRSAAVTGDTKFSDYPEKHLQFIADKLPYFVRGRGGVSIGFGLLAPNGLAP